MSKRSRIILAGCACLLLAGLASAVALGAAQPDYSNLPPDPAKVQKQLEALDASLAGAVRKAEEAAGGRALSAAIDLDATPAKIAVTVFAGGAKHQFEFNARDFSLLSRQTVPPYTLPGWNVEGAWTETKSGLKYWDIKVGEGRQADPSKSVSVHYSGWLVDGKKFDSSHDRGQPATFPLRGVIPGWTEGVAAMREGGKRKLVIPYDLAYGPAGRPPVIPARAMLIFDIELITVH